MTFSGAAAAKQAFHHEDAANLFIHNKECEYTVCVNWRHVLWQISVHHIEIDWFYRHPFIFIKVWQQQSCFHQNERQIFNKFRVINQRNRLFSSTTAMMMIKSLISSMIRNTRWKPKLKQIRYLCLFHVLMLINKKVTADLCGPMRAMRKQLISHVTSMFNSS